MIFVLCQLNSNVSCYLFFFCFVTHCFVVNVKKGVGIKKSTMAYTLSVNVNFFLMKILYFVFVDQNELKKNCSKSSVFSLCSTVRERKNHSFVH